MSSAEDKVRDGLRAAAKRRKAAQRELEKADREVARWAERSRRVIPQAEVEKITGLTRMQVHRMIGWARGEKTSRH